MSNCLLGLIFSTVGAVLFGFHQINNNIEANIKNMFLFYVVSICLILGGFFLGRVQ